MSMSVVTVTTTCVSDKLRGGPVTKVRRYWPGKIPPEWEWADDDDDDAIFHVLTVRNSKDNSSSSSSLHLFSSVRPEIVSTIVKEARRQEEFEFKQEQDDEEEDVMAETERRIQLKAKLLQREQEETLPREEEEEQEMEYDEYETESDEEEYAGQVNTMMNKPVFVSKFERVTVAQHSLEAQQSALEEEELRRTRRLEETKRFVAELISKDKQIHKYNNITHITDSNTDDQINEAEEEYEAWKAREIRRIKRNRDYEETLLKDKEKVKRLRKMTVVKERDNPKSKPTHSFMLVV